MWQVNSKRAVDILVSMSAWFPPSSVTLLHASTGCCQLSDWQLVRAVSISRTPISGQ